MPKGERQGASAVRSELGGRGNPGLNVLKNPFPAVYPPWRCSDVVGRHWTIREGIEQDAESLLITAFLNDQKPSYPRCYPQLILRKY